MDYRLSSSNVRLSGWQKAWAMVLLDHVFGYGIKRIQNFSKCYYNTLNSVKRNKSCGKIAMKAERENSYNFTTNFINF